MRIYKDMATKIADSRCLFNNIMDDIYYKINMAALDGKYEITIIESDIFVKRILEILEKDRFSIENVEELSNSSIFTINWE